MAYTQSPTNDTYSTVKIPLVQDLQTMPGDISLASFISGMVNVFPYKDINGDLYAETRDAIRGNTVVTTSTENIRGAYVWEKTAGTVYYFVVTGNGTTSYMYSSANGTTWTQLHNWATTSINPARFTEFIDATNTKKLIMVDGVKGFVYTDNSTSVEITDVDFPTPHVPFPVFMDGYLFLAKAGTGDIYNSNLNDPVTWTAGDFISSELYPDDIQALVRIDNYLLAIGTQGCEYFYDAANAIASPLARQEGASLPFGTVLPNTIAYNKNTVIMLANNNDGEVIFKHIEGFKHSDLSGETVLRVFGSIVSSSSIPDARSTRAFFIRQNGKLFYVFQMFRQIAGFSSQQPTVYMSLDTKHWGILQSQFEGWAYPVYFSCISNTTNMFTYVAGQTTDRVFFGTLNPGFTSAQDRFNGSTGVNIFQKIRIPAQSFGTMNRKFMNRFGVFYYRMFDSTNPITVAWDDTNNPGAFFTTYSVLAGYANYSGAGDVGFPFVTQMGTFRWRQFELRTDGGCIRWMYAETDINKGQQ